MTMISRRFAVLSYFVTILAAVFASLAADGAADPQVFRGALMQMLEETQHPFLEHADLRAEVPMLREVYEERSWAPLWSDKDAPTRPAIALLQALRDADRRALRAEDYEGNLISYQLVDLLAQHDPDDARWAQIDLALSVAAIRFMNHLHAGRIDPGLAGFNLKVGPPRIDQRALLRQLAAASDPDAVFRTIEPPFVHYRLLGGILNTYRLLARDPSLTDLPRIPTRSVRPGESYAGAAALRRLLVALGDLRSEDALPDTDVTLDPALVAALKRFQERHGLDIDGALGKRTFAALTMPLAARVRQIEITLERWRWLPRFESPPIVVNIPQYRLFAFRSTVDEEAQMLQMDVIVGQSFRHTQTPIFMEDMRYVVFRPYWDVPYSIATRELLPEIRANPGYLERTNLEIVRGSGDDAPPVPVSPEAIEGIVSGELRLRQRPGPDNSLGLIKFMLPNAHRVYLHSTPAHRLFRESRRTFSHGCVRVSDPVSLAEHVLRNAPGDWTREAIEAAMNGTQTLTVHLSKPIPVLIVYGTVIVTESGLVLFLDDVYGHDRKLAGLMGED